MNRIAKFEKVSLKQFKADYEACFGTDKGAEEAYDKIKLPVRATSGSAGYDIVSPVDIKLFEGEWMKVPTGLRVKIDDGWVLLILPKSRLKRSENSVSSPNCSRKRSSVSSAPSRTLSASFFSVFVPARNCAISSEAASIPSLFSFHLLLSAILYLPFL